MRRSKQAGENKDPWQAPDPALAVALKQLKWFARHRNRARVTYQVNEILILLTTATTTVTAALKVSAAATAILAASTVVLAGLYKVLDSHENWLAFGSAWADLQAAVNDYRIVGPSLPSAVTNLAQPDVYASRLRAHLAVRGGRLRGALHGTPVAAAR